MPMSMSNVRQTFSAAAAPICTHSILDYNIIIIIFITIVLHFSMPLIIIIIPPNANANVKRLDRLSQLPPHLSALTQSQCRPANFLLQKQTEKSSPFSRMLRKLSTFFKVRKCHNIFKIQEILQMLKCINIRVIILEYPHSCINVTCWRLCRWFALWSLADWILHHILWGA